LKTSHKNSKIRFLTTSFTKIQDGAKMHNFCFQKFFKCPLYE
jgi:hypothetical protein